MDRCNANRFYVINRGMKTEHFDDRRRSRFEPSRWRGISGFFEGHAVDHRAATLPRRHCVEMIGAAPEDADAGGAIEFVTRENIEVAIEIGDIDGETGNGLATVQQQLRADTVRELCRALGVENTAEHVGNMRKGDHRMRRRQQGFGGVKVDLAINGQRADVDFITRKLPRHDVAVVLELA